MSDAIVAKRYADALFQLAKDKNNLETIREELKVVRDVFIENPKMKEVLYHPRIKDNDKVALIDSAFGSCNEDIIHTIASLTERRSIEYVTDIVAYLTDKDDADKRIAEAPVYSVRQLTASEKENVNAALANPLDKQEVLIKHEVDADILGALK